MLTGAGERSSEPERLTGAIAGLPVGPDIRSIAFADTEDDRLTNRECPGYERRIDSTGINLVVVHALLGHYGPVLR